MNGKRKRKSHVQEEKVIVRRNRKNKQGPKIKQGQRPREQRKRQTANCKKFPCENIKRNKQGQGVDTNLGRKGDKKKLWGWKYSKWEKTKKEARWSRTPVSIPRCNRMPKRRGGRQLTMGDKKGQKKIPARNDKMGT